MADTLKVLGQVNPTATTLTTAYTAPSLTTAIVRSILVANRSATPTSFRVSIAVAGATDDNKQYTHYDVPISGNETMALEIAATLGAADVVRVYATLATLSFNLFGLEVS